MSILYSPYRMLSVELFALTRAWLCLQQMEVPSGTLRQSMARPICCFRESVAPQASSYTDSSDLRLWENDTDAACISSPGAANSRPA